MNKFSWLAVLMFPFFNSYYFNKKINLDIYQRQTEIVQKSDLDELSKYSYYFYAQTKDCRIIDRQIKCRMVGSTGFLVKDGKDLYLVSAAHSLFDLQHKGEPPLTYEYPKLFYLRLYKKKSNLPDTIPIDLSKLRPTDNYFYNHSDVFWIKINTPVDKYQIHTINHLLSKKKSEYTKIKETVMFGFPQLPSFDQNRHAIEMTFSPSNYLDSVNITENKTESQAALIPISGYGDKGYSGSPLFLKLSNSKIVFGGLCIAENNGRIIFVRPKFVFKEAPFTTKLF